MVRGRGEREGGKGDTRRILHHLDARKRVANFDTGTRSGMECANSKHRREGDLLEAQEGRHCRCDVTGWAGEVVGAFRTREESVSGREGSIYR